MQMMRMGFFAATVALVLGIFGGTQRAGAVVPEKLDTVYLKEYTDPDPDAPFRMTLYPPELTGDTGLYRLKIELGPHVIESFGWDLSGNMKSGAGIFLSVEDPGLIMLAIEDDKAYFLEEQHLYFRETQEDLSNLVRDYKGTKHHEDYGREYTESKPEGMWKILNDDKFKAAGEFAIGLTPCGTLFSVVQAIDKLKGIPSENWSVTTKRPGTYTWSSHDKSKKPYAVFTNEKIYDVQTKAWTYLRGTATLSSRLGSGEGYDINYFFGLKRAQPEKATLLFIRAVIPYNRIYSTGGYGTSYPKGRWLTKYVEIEWRVNLPGTGGKANNEVRSAGSRYELGDEELAWGDAKRACQEKGGHLVTISSQAENDLVAGLLRDNGVSKAWIGYSDKNREDDWQWVTGGSGPYTNWAPGEPNDAGGKEDGAEICADDGAWNDWAMPDNQDQKHRFVCEYPPTQAETEDEGVSTTTSSGKGADTVKTAPKQGEVVVCLANDSQSWPDVYGNTIVWTHKPGSDIHAWDPVNGERVICNAPREQWYPAIYDDTIVWEDSRNGKSDIYAWNPDKGEWAVCTADGYQGKPAIYGDTIVWADGRKSANRYDIYAWSPERGEWVVCSAPEAQGWPAIYGDTIVWQDKRNGNYDIYAWSPERGEWAVCTAKGDQMFPALWEDTIVWKDRRTGGWDIYAWNPDKGEWPVCTAENDQGTPDIHDGVIVWTDGRGGIGEIYLWDEDRGERKLLEDGRGRSSPAIHGSTIAYEGSLFDSRSRYAICAYFGRR